AVPDIMLIELLDALFDRPLGAKGGDVRRQLLATHAIAPRIGTATFGILDRAARYDPLDDLSNFRNLVVFSRAADVECLVVDRLARRLEDRQERPGNILDMDEGSPRCPVASNQHVTCGVSHAHEIV